MLTHGKGILSYKLLTLSKWIVAFLHLARHGRLSADNYLEDEEEEKKKMKKSMK